MNVFDLPIHPAAAIFPMLSDEELKELAADIQAHGLLHPIIVKEGQLIDGRNRRAACLALGIEPAVEELNGVDPVTFIFSANINRRHLSKGQRAMAVAKLYPDGDALRGKKPVINTGLSSEYVKHARTVLRWLPEIADLVLAGTKPLNEAYQEAQRLKEQTEAEPARLKRLRRRAPDLADLVDDGRMRLLEAESAYETRQEETRRQRQAVAELFNGLERMLDVLAAGKRRANVIEHLDQPTDRKRARALCKAWIKNLSETLEELS